MSESEAASGAIITSCGNYRYLLWRSWSPGPTCLWVMLNPSTADHAKNDPTITRCIRWSREWGFGRLEVVNLFAFRSPSVAAMRAADDPIGPENDHAIMAALSKGPGRVVSAWGNNGKFRGHGQSVLEMIRDAGFAPRHLGLTKQGEPRHPLLVGYGVEAEEW